MIRTVILGACLALSPAFPAAAQDGGPLERQPRPEVRELSGMSIVGNDEAPKSLYIVPWKSSEIGEEPSLNLRFDGSAAPVGREVLLRQLAYHRFRTATAGRRP